MRAASALSTHPVVATALGECAGQVLEALDGATPAFALVAVTPPHLGTLEDVGAALAALLRPGVTVGAVASSVAGGGHHVEAEAALTLFAVAGVTASPLRLEPAAGGHLRRHGHQGHRVHQVHQGGAAAGVVLGDPFSCSGPALLHAVHGWEVCGGLLGAARGPGGSRLLLDGAVHTSGAVGALLGPPVRAVASQGGTPLGAAFVITAAEGDAVLELAGRPAGERWREVLGDDAQPGLAALGLLLDEHAERPGRGDLKLVRVLGPARRGGLRVAEPLAVGRVVRFVRVGAGEVQADLAEAVATAAPAPAACLVFPGADRAADAGVVAEVFATTTAGVGVSAPLAPLAGATTLHGAGATGLLLFP